MRTSVTALSGQALTATGSTSAIGITNGIDLVVAFISVSAVSGTSPTATFVLQASPDGTNWFDMDTSASITAAANITLALPINKPAPFVRVSYTLGGTTPSFTTSIWIEGRD